MFRKSTREFGEMAIVLGDMCIPNRSSKIPDKFEKLLKASKDVKMVLCTGNLSCKSVEQQMMTLAPIVHIVRGDLDDVKEFPGLTLEKKIKFGNFTIGLTHGHQIVPWGDIQSLANYQRKINVDILITGHTHQAEIIENGDGWLINPGSVTGAFNATSPKTIPSFMVLSAKDNVCQAYLYQIKDKKVIVSTQKFQKKL
mmetsp:Transcript_19891/g.27751  ORF Transcript_19891/g.27751 Transcript_19891/m.27751 type:complete len:198 (-) Transcript_19891:327-920(-)|eukprot:CAMPEP_0184479354 /NCGR_PEP_ID=MMETSP0113_2-20130426/1111_1 /TAXON_ID=91329 /ORGANISM="Norrisiella sphaerica, Strain BC52" /LENGTH=197 /DNA_ID=CAMNT_0026857417 /DNA_START=59 /DNA_END=652 /DNA_ORIENTATION=+